MPTGHYFPCCGLLAYAEHHVLDWLPHAEKMAPADALTALRRMYRDPASPMAGLCAKCSMWSRFSPPTIVGGPKRHPAVKLEVVNPACRQFHFRSDI